MQSDRLLRFATLFSTLTVALLLQGGACRTTVDDGEDAGPNGEEPTYQTCEAVEECPDPTNWECVGGSCLQRCAADEVCRLDQFCSGRGYCEFGCRDSSTCPDGEVCVNGACADASTAGACGSKCDCDPGQVCADGVCQSPPATCESPDDCARGPADRCEAYQCNGFTQACFDPDPQPCDTGDDCVGRPGCDQGCVCTPNQQCVPAGGCTAATEADDCGPGFYCTMDLACGVLPACTQESDCSGEGLTCNLGTGQCERPQPCTASTECTSAPNTYCDTSGAVGACVVPTCNNGGVTCDTQTQVCAESGACVPLGTGEVCDSDLDCPNDLWPDTQFCSFATGSGECTPGCRSNASCTGGDTCNGARQCVAGGSGGSGLVGDACDEIGIDPDCPAGTLCKLDTGTCEETCDTVGSCAGGACCPLSGYANCSEGILFSWCTP
jgi:hypothetical protein